jgi:hypothetical protein
MKFHPALSRSLLLFLLGCAFAGCSSIASRIQEKSAVFAALDPQTQARIRKGDVELGDTPDMVYMALGRPSVHSEKTSAAGRELIWIYASTYQEYVGTARVGYRRVFVQDPRTGATAVYVEPVYNQVYRDRTEENIRIIFHQDRVAVIEQAKP